VTSSISAALTCGVGTTMQGNECVASPETCGPGTHQDTSSNACVAETAYLVRGTTTVYGDGATPAEVVAFGTNPDGTPATDQIVIDTDRPGAGVFQPPTLTLDEVGGVASYVPCDSKTAGCVGPVNLTLALASNPNAPVASFGINLVAPPGVYSAEHCPTGRSGLYLDGQGFLYRGKIMISDAVFMPTGDGQHLNVLVEPNQPIQGTSWSLDFSTAGLGVQMTPGVYPIAAIKITGATPFAYCTSSVTGEFQVFDYSYTTSVDHATISFREWCPSDPTNVVSGCVHVE
jgi:hypothetical protein